MAICINKVKEQAFVLLAFTKIPCVILFEQLNGNVITTWSLQKKFDPKTRGN